MRKCFITAAIALALGATQFASATPVEFSASGARPADVQAAVSAFRSLLGTNHLALHGSARYIKRTGIAGRGDVARDRRVGQRDPGVGGGGKCRMQFEYCASQHVGSTGMWHDQR